MHTLCAEKRTRLTPAISPSCSTLSCITSGFDDIDMRLYAKALKFNLRGWMIIEVVFRTPGRNWRRGKRWRRLCPERFRSLEDELQSEWPTIRGAISSNVQCFKVFERCCHSSWVCTLWVVEPSRHWGRCCHEPTFALVTLERIRTSYFGPDSQQISTFRCGRWLPCSHRFWDDDRCKISVKS